MSAGIVSVYAVFADGEEARRLGRLMIEEQKAACVNIIGSCHSIYRWRGKVEEAEEVAAIFKTREDRASALVARIAELHSYDVPAITVWEIAASPQAYCAWIEESLR